MYITALKWFDLGVLISLIDTHEMGFEEFMDCMKELHKLHSSRRSEIDKKIETAAVTIQRRVRGIKARMAARREKHEKEYFELPRKTEIQEDDIAQVIKLQALARARKERIKLQQALKFREAIKNIPAQVDSQNPGWWGGPAIKGRVRKSGDLHYIQEKLKVLFICVQDAFVWFDNDGNERSDACERLHPNLCWLIRFVNGAG